MANKRDWREVLEPVVERYRERNLRRFFRGDAAFAAPDIYDGQIIKSGLPNDRKEKFPPSVTGFDYYWLRIGGIWEMSDKATK